LRTHDNQPRIVDALAVWSANENHWVLTLHDVTEQHALRDQLMERAFYDSLTGLANRELFRDHLRTTLARKQRYGGEFAVIMIDLDDFKQVNDSLGHAAGDLLLSEVGRRIRMGLRDSDTAARLGGDEFAVIVDNLTTPEAALEVADRIIDWISAPFTVLGREIIPSASLGITLGADGKTADDLERNCDLALYRAKDEGRNRWALYHHALHHEAVQRLTQVGELHTAVEQDQIEPWYQPIIDLETGAIAGVEALARWVHPTRGILPPGSFIPVAESSGLIVDIGRQLLRRSADELATIRRTYPDMSSLRLSVNVSPRQMLDDRLVDDIRFALESNNLEPHSLILEITESVLLPQEGIPMERLNQIHDLGVSLYIDDFGTGWSSLSYLRTLPVGGMKLAREFVVGLSDSHNVGLVTAIRDIAVNLQFDQTVAEGIETDEQRQELIKHGYTLGQGYLLAKPMPFAELIAYLATRPSIEWVVPTSQVHESVDIPF
jgi:diguanylate cyclase (GGDEF)-like protein